MPVTVIVAPAADGAAPAAGSGGRAAPATTKPSWPAALQLLEERVRFGPRGKVAEEHAVQPRSGANATWPATPISEASRSAALRAGSSCENAPAWTWKTVSDAPPAGPLAGTKDDGPLQELGPIAGRHDPQSSRRSDRKIGQVAFEAETIEHARARRRLGRRNPHRGDGHGRFGRRRQGRRGRARGRTGRDRQQAGEKKTRGALAGAPSQNRDRIRVPRTSLRKSPPRSGTIRHIS